MLHTYIFPLGGFDILINIKPKLRIVMVYLLALLMQKMKTNLFNLSCQLDGNVQCNSILVAT